MKSVDRLIPAYFDSAGVTAAFILSALRVLNRQLGAHFDLDDFDYIPFWDLRGGTGGPPAALHPRPGRAHRRFRPDVELFPGEEIRVEISAKFRLDALTAEHAAAGLVLRSRWSDPIEDFGLCLAECSTGRGRAAVDASPTVSTAVERGISDGVASFALGKGVAYRCTEGDS